MMRSSRVIRPARILPEAFQVVVPESVSALYPDGAIPGPDLRESAEERERNLRRSLEDLERRLADRQDTHGRELKDLKERMEASTREQIDAAVNGFTSMVDDFVAQRAEFLKSSEETLVRLAVAVAKKIIGDAVQIQEDAVLETVRNALRHVQEKENVVVRVHPEDLKIVREHRSEWLSIVEGSGSLDIEEDERVRRGGCLVETEAGNVEAQIDKQIQTLERMLVERV